MQPQYLAVLQSLGKQRESECIGIHYIIRTAVDFSQDLVQEAAICPADFDDGEGPVRALRRRMAANGFDKDRGGVAPSEFGGGGNSFVITGPVGGGRECLFSS